VKGRKTAREKEKNAAYKEGKRGVKKKRTAREKEKCAP
jgi:hypothetical protein